MPVKIHTILIGLLSQTQAMLVRNQQLLWLYSTLGLPAAALAWASSRKRRKSNSETNLTMR